MDIRKNLYKISPNRLSRMELRFLDYEEKIQQLPKHAQKTIKEKTAMFKQLKKYHRIILAVEITCILLIYISFISLLTTDLPILSLLTKEAATLSASIGIPILTIILFFMEKTKNLLIVDGMWVMGEIIAITTTYSKKTK